MWSRGDYDEGKEYRRKVHYLYTLNRGYATGVNREEVIVLKQ